LKVDNLQAGVRFATGIPRLRAAASLKVSQVGAREVGSRVFRGFVPRPH